MKENLEDILNKYDGMFNEIRQILEMRQKEITQNCTQLFKNEIDHLETRMVENQNRIGKMTQCRTEWINGQNLPKI